ncbi:MAG: hypothetical protein ACRC4Y_07530, partial [Cetobacterium sp.]
PAWNHAMAFHHNMMASSITAANPNIENFSTSSLALIKQEVIIQSSIMGINDILIGSGVIALILIPFLFLGTSTKSTQQ